MSSFDVAVIGSGPGGYVAAIRCAQLGLSTALIEKYDTLGDCLNVGCIPSKSLWIPRITMRSRLKIFHHGIDVEGEIKINFGQMMKRKSEVIEQTQRGLTIWWIKTKSRFFTALVNLSMRHISKSQARKTDDRSQTQYHCNGFQTCSFTFVTLDKERIITSTEALSLTKIPKHLVVIGGGVIGLELGQVYRRLGAEVSVVNMPIALRQSWTVRFPKNWWKWWKNKALNSISPPSQWGRTQGRWSNRHCKDKRGRRYVYGRLLPDVCWAQTLYRRTWSTSRWCCGQWAWTSEVNKQLQTSTSNIYAIGDVVRGAMLAHKAEEEGVMAAEIIAGQQPHIDHNLIPNVIYTWPEVAAVGKTEDELKAAGVGYKAGQFSMRAWDVPEQYDTDGFVKILADAKTDEVLGIHIIGARAADLIAQAVTAMEFRASAEDIARMSHAHPTYAEAMKGPLWLPRKTAPYTSRQLIF